MDSRYDQFSDVFAHPSKETKEPRHFRGILFTDIDGTLVHYGQTIPTDPAKASNYILLPRSTKQKDGTISKSTLFKLSALRANNLAVVLITGARTPTIMNRLPYLPAADAIITENGGVIFYPDGSLPTAVPLRQDLDWRATMEEVVGPLSAVNESHEERPGLLWQWYRELAAAGWVLDGAGYTANFRVSRGPNHSEQDLKDVIARCPPGLSCSFNLGHADFYPATSGKASAASYLMGLWGVTSADCVFMCDDDNDLELAQLVNKSFLPSITSASVAAAVAANPDQFVTCPNKTGSAATEFMIEQVADHYGIACYG